MTRPAHTLSVAPMMDWTDRHCRAFHRVLTRRTLLYSEMVTSAAVVHGDARRLLEFQDCAQPVALQLGGSDPGQLAAAARIGEDFGYGEINLNAGCPSDRVQSGRFGACLMREPQLVADCLGEMAAAVRVPVTLKCRIGVDDQDPEQALPAMVEACAAAGATTFIVHARKAWLQGLSPKQNRDVPPLDYGLVYALKAARPDLTIVLNGGVPDLEAAAGHLARVDGVMLGRAAYHTPGMLGRADAEIFGEGDGVGEAQAVEAYRPYIAARLAEGVHLGAMTRHMLGLFQGRRGARAWRRVLTEGAVRPGAGLEVLDAALERVATGAEAQAA